MIAHHKLYVFSGIKGVTSSRWQMLHSDVMLWTCLFVSSFGLESVYYCR